MYLKGLADAQYNAVTGVRNETTDEALKDGMHAANYGTPGTPFAYQAGAQNSGDGPNVMEDYTVIDPRTGQGQTLQRHVDPNLRYLDVAAAQNATMYYSQLQHGGGDMVGTRPLPAPEESKAVIPQAMAIPKFAMTLPAAVTPVASTTQVPVTATAPASMPTTTMQIVQDQPGISTAVMPDVTPIDAGGTGTATTMTPLMWMLAASAAWLLLKD